MNAWEPRSSEPTLRRPIDGGEVAFRLLQWAAAFSLIWIGLSTAGLLPSPALIDRGFGVVSAAVARVQLPARPKLTPLVTGQYTFTVARDSGEWRIKSWKAEMDGKLG